MGDVLQQVGNAFKAAADFRARIEASHREQPKWWQLRRRLYLQRLERIEALLTDILGVLNAEFQLRPRGE
jgi:hypothetical protein